MDIFGLAYLELKREGILNKYSAKREGNLMIDRAIRIVKWLNYEKSNKKNSEKRRNRKLLKV